MTTLTFDRNKFECVTSQLHFNQWINRLKLAKSICFDTETTGLDTFTCDLVGLAFAAQDGNEIKACYVPIGHQDRHGKQLSWHCVKNPVRQLLQSGKPIVMANALYDMLVMRQDRYAVDIANVHDTQLMSYALTGNLHFEHGMDALAERILNYKTIKFKDIVDPKRGVPDFSHVDLRTATLYSAEDAAITLTIAKVLQQQLKSIGKWRLYNEIDRPLLPVLADAKLRGVAVDFKRLEKLGEEWQPILAKLEKKAHKQAGTVFNLRSPQQVQKLLYGPKAEGGLAIEVPTHTNTNELPATDKETLQEIYGVPLVDTLLEFKQYVTINSNFVEGLPKKRNEITGRVHTELKITSTKTRRFSSAGPNLQNIPTRTEEGQEIRDAFIAAPGHLLISADYSQIEYRILAHVTKAPYLLHAFHNKIDMHAKMAADIYGGDWQDYNNKKDAKRYSIRGACKNVNFAVIYGAGPPKVAHMSKIALTEAYRILEAHEEMVPEVYAWKEQVWDQARKDLFVENLFGGRTHVQYINSKNRELRGHAERLAINAPIQGGAAELIRKAMPRVHKAVLAYDAYLLLQVHDELVLECVKAQAEKCALDVRREMETAADDWVKWEVPIVAETGIGKTWREAK